ncbi:MAG TPA: patatin-like phospholipase family protein [Candidatus Tectomicrobia bacterium]
MVQRSQWYSTRRRDGAGATAGPGRGRWSSMAWPVLVLCCLSLSLAGCSALERSARPMPELLQLRETTATQLAEDTRAIIGRAIAREKDQYDAYQAGRLSTPPVIDILIVSGGGDWGAFGAGFLKGWGQVPAGPMARPQFDIVTGVSTGALIAPFAFLGTEDTFETIVQLYRHPKPDWVKQRGMLYFLPNNISFAEVPGLEREMRERIDLQLVQRLVADGQDGRLLIVNTTNVDNGDMRAWDVVAEAQRGLKTDDVDRVHRILLASSGIPGAFPFREIDGEMYVDGGITGNILYGGRLGEKETFAAVWATRYPDIPMPLTRYWVIFNNQLLPPPQVTAPNWPAVVSRSLEMSTRAATVTALRHLYSMSEIARLKHGVTIEIRVAAIPGDWVPPEPGVFKAKTMNNLADLGERMGADPASWLLAPP